MILAIPKPPTRMEKLPITQPATLSTSKVELIKFTSASGRLSAKSSSCFGLSPRLWRMSPRSSYSSSTNPMSEDFPLAVIDEPIPSLAPL
eukprot:CAMPEP_0175810296 /NCGR_PEP_ID=MMETSP0107_2-20121207/3249_1 /TAXON_ID=195067 ORGANISM="Goniomonas pacifica, Strain CCMP1869" /NCGR_SAMPLE_ID=MMETSP0107_2 /ASSEMBLY_ACC=CAM_ASM_000203 /LENGTH=89 /DNA_ID=CAMNT_0017122045 /DNA_START=300 /DNA_END=572 /DNA_ORIENTATION=+